MVEASGVRLSARVTPRRSLLRTGIIACFAGGVPLFGVLYWLALDQGNWVRVLIVHLAVSVIALVLGLRWRAGFVEVADGVITKQSFATRSQVNCSDIVSVVIAQTYVGHADSQPQLLAFDRDGQRAFRMRGIYWSRDDMVLIAEAIGAPVLFEPDPMTTAEFYATYPGVAYWYEGRPWLAISGIAVALCFSFLLMSWVMLAIGVPSSLSLLLP